MATPFNCMQQGIQTAGLPSTSLYLIDLVTGALSLVGPLQPSGMYNAIGYSVINGYVYGYNQTISRIVIINPDATTDTLADVPNLPDIDYNVGDIDLNGYYYIYQGSSSRFYVVDVNPARSTYLQLVDPANSFQLQTSDFGVLIAPTNIRDWSFNPMDGHLYAVEQTAQVVRINPITGAVTTLTTLGPMTPSPYGANFFDCEGNFYAFKDNTGEVFKIVILGATATATLFSTATASPENDGARCPHSQMDLITVVKSVDKTKAVLGERLTYTIVITNKSTTIDATNVIFTDSYPNGTTYVTDSATLDSNPVAPETPAGGITIGTIPTSTSVTVAYQVDISSTTLPYPNPIPNSGTLTYTEGMLINSNTVFTKVSFPERGVLFI